MKYYLKFLINNKEKINLNIAALIQDSTNLFFPDFSNLFNYFNITFNLSWFTVDLGILSNFIGATTELFLKIES